MDKFEQITKLAQAYFLITEVINARDAKCEIAIELQLAANIVADLSDDIEGVE